MPNSESRNHWPATSKKKLRFFVYSYFLHKNQDRYPFMPVSVPFFFGSKQLTIDLAAPVIILRGPMNDSVTQVLRGEVELVLTKPTTVSSVTIKLVGKSHTMWPEGIGHRGTKLYHEKTIHQQTLILQSWAEDFTLEAGLHRWPFEFLISNQLVETIEDDTAKTFYYCSAAVLRNGKGNSRQRCRRNILLLRVPHLSDSALTDNSLPTTSIVSERHLDACDATLCVEKSIASSGTQFPIIFHLTPNQKHVHVEAISVMLQERRVYRLPEYQARRTDFYDSKLSLNSVSSMSDPSLWQRDQIPNDILRHVMSVKNAHIPLDNMAFHHRYVFTLPNCVHLNHSTFYHEIDIRHYLKIDIELSVPTQSNRIHLHLEIPITVLDCRLKEDTSTLPTYEEALSDPTFDEHDESQKPAGFFVCPCYLKYKKTQLGCGKQEWAMLRQNNAHHDPPEVGSPPPPYDTFKPTSSSSTFRPTTT